MVVCTYCQWDEVMRCKIYYCLHVNGQYLKVNIDEDSLSSKLEQQHTACQSGCSSPTHRHEVWQLEGAREGAAAARRGPQMQMTMKRRTRPRSLSVCSILTGSSSDPPLTTSHRILKDEITSTILSIFSPGLGNPLVQPLIHWFLLCWVKCLHMNCHNIWHRHLN